MANSGQFQKGYDPRRHVLTKEECAKGYNSLLDKFINGGNGTDSAKRRAFRQMCKTEAVRYDNPDIAIKEPMRLWAPDKATQDDWENRSRNK